MEHLPFTHSRWKAAMTSEPESNSTPEHPIQPQPVFCSSCGSTQFLKHLNGCEDWQIPVQLTESKPTSPDPGLIPDPSPSTYAEAQLSRLLARCVEEGWVKIIGFNEQGQPVYQGTGRPRPRTGGH